MVRAHHGFFHARQPVDSGIEAGPAGTRDYPNVPRSIGAVLSSRMATMRELDELGLEDVYDMLEVLTVDAQNAEIMRRREV